MSEKAYVRAHVNGMNAWVYEQEDTPSQFSTEVRPHHVDVSSRSVATMHETLAEAKRWADGASGCEQPCVCPQWSDEM
jgi:hypothetical protein